MNSPDAQTNNGHRRYNGDTNAIALGELRGRRGHAQSEVAAVLGNSQANVSRIERQNDLCVSTLDEYVAALGGTLRILAEFPDETVELAPSRRAMKAAAERAASA
jgi:transcriptional regulator with XRE-family HTH domain